MVTSMIPNVNNVFKNPNIIDMRFLSANIPYNPLINYDWSTTTTSGLRYLKDVGSTPTYNASMYFGRGAYLNGVDQSITIPINTTIQTALKRVNGIVTINETSQTLTNYVISGLGVHKDYYLFTRLLTTAEKDSYTNTPELFYAMAQADSTCVLNMPMCETSSTVRNYKNGADYPITNYTSSVRDNAKNLQYGLQTCKFVRDSLGVIQTASDYLECDGVGYADTGWIPDLTQDFTIEWEQYKLNYNWASNTGKSYYAGGITLYNNKDFYFGDTSNGLFAIKIGDGQVTIGNDIEPLLANNYYKIFARFNASTKELKMFVGGYSKATTIITYISSGYSLVLCQNARWYSIGLNPLTTPLKTFKIHNKALTETEMGL